MRRDAFKWAADAMLAEQQQQPQPQPQQPQPTAESGTDPGIDTGMEAGMAAEQQAGINEERKQELHDQALRHKEDLHQAKMQAAGMKMQQAQQQFEAKQLAAQPAPMTIEELRSRQSQEQNKYRGNLIPKQGPFNPLAKRAAAYTDAELADAAFDYPDPVTPTAIGAGVGAVGAHMVSPAEKTRHYRKAIEDLSPHIEDAERVRASGKIPTNVVIEDAGKRYQLPADEAARMLRSMAWSSNAKRLAKGTALGAGAGLLTHLLLGKSER